MSLERPRGRRLVQPDENWSHILLFLKHNMFNDMLTMKKNVSNVHGWTIMLTGNNDQSIFFGIVLTV